MEEEEELLVDDFDGQCCRTYPDNHSKITQWRKRKLTLISTTTTTVTVASTSVTTVVPGSDLISPKRRKVDDLPVGIAIGRRRENDREKPGPSSRDIATPSDPFVGHRWPGFEPPFPGMTGSFPPPPPPWGATAGMNVTKPPYGPIPMGYQLARDPLTGQILLIPTSDASVWPGQPSIPPPAGHLPAPSPSHRSLAEPLLPQRKREPPETITVSDSDEEHQPPRLPSPPREPETPAVTQEVRETVTVVKTERLSVHEPAEETPDVETAVKDEPEPEVDEDSTKLVAEIMLELSEQVVETHEGFNALLDGINIKQEAEMREWHMFHTLCEATRQDCYDLGLGDRCHKLGVGVLCEATYQEYVEILNWVDPLTLLKKQYNLHQYQSQESEVVAKKFIEEKMSEKRDETGLQLEEGFQCPTPKIKSLERVLHKIKNMEIMSELEVDLRSKICQLQALYQDKQSELSKMKLSPKKLLRKQKQRGPGRPKKRTLKSVKRKMGRPRKIAVKTTESPPSLTPMDGLAAALKSSQGQLLRPPKLTASTSAQKSSYVTNLSTISARFMKGKANPFANLMKLASTPSETPVKEEEPSTCKEVSSTSSSEDESPVSSRVTSPSPSSDESDKETLASSFRSGKVHAARVV